MVDDFILPDRIGSSEEDTPFEVDVTVFVGSSRVSKKRFPPGSYLIGNDPSCHLHVEAESVARMHARFTFYGHRLSIEDLESESGVSIGGVKLDLPTPIQPGSEVHIGSSRLLFEFDENVRRRIEAELGDPTLGLEAIRAGISQEPHQITGTLGEGGMGVVLKALDQRIHRSVAMKVLRQGNEFSAEKLQRFVAEAQLTGQLEHPNIVPVYQLGIGPDGQVFYTMKHVRGQTLEQVLTRLREEDEDTQKQYPLSHLVTVFQKVADAIAFAHSHGVLHRDLKPSNIMIGSFGEVLVMDWGLAKRLVEANQETQHPSPIGQQLQPYPGDRQSTLQGIIAGTPPFLSPEQTDSRASPDQRSDIFVLGIILYEILCLRPPIDLQGNEKMIKAIRNGEFIPLEDRIRTTDEEAAPNVKLIHCPGGRLPAGLIAVVQKAMQHSPEQRYQSVAELQADIVAYQNGFAPEAEEASWFRQLQLLLGRRRREAVLVACFFVLSQLLLAYFLGRITSDKKILLKSQIALASSNQRLEQIVFQLRKTANNNYRDAINQLRLKKPNEALKQINLALVGVADIPATQSRYLVARGHANAQLGFYAEALEDYRQASLLSPGNVPIPEIEADLTRAMEDGMRPHEGWLWEKIDMPASLKPRQQQKNTPQPLRP